MKKAISKQRNLVRLAVLIISVFSLTYIASCSSFLKQENTPTLSQYAVQIDNTALDVSNLTSIEVTKSDFVSNKFKLSQTRADISNESAKALIGKLQSYFKNFLVSAGETHKYITIYTTGSMKDIQLSEIKGISFFTFKGDGLGHRFYITNGHNLVEDKRLAVSTDYFYTAEMHLMGNAIFKDPSIKWTMFAIPAPANARLSATSFTVLNKINNLSSAITKVSGTQLEGEVLLSDGCDGCGGGSGACTQDSQGWWCCSTCGGCEATAINVDGSSLGLALDLHEAYKFRDNFMAKSDIGQKYINYYYLISKAAIDNKAINSKTIRNYFDFAQKVYSCAKTMQLGDDNEIVCSLEFKTQAIELIENYRSFSNDKTYQLALLTIEKDLNKFSGKTKSHIVSNWK